MADTLENRVFHREKFRIARKMDLYTELSTVSTRFWREAKRIFTGLSERMFCEVLIKNAFRDKKCEKRLTFLMSKKKKEKL